MKNVTKADAEKMYEGLLKGANSVHPRVSTTGAVDTNIIINWVMCLTM